MYRLSTFGLIVLAALTLTLLIAPASLAGIIHVKTDGNDANDGSSWALAKATVRAGLNAAVSSDEVWVAAGTYVENISLKEGVGLYGGFVGTETGREQRDWRNNETVIDGGGGNVVTGASISTIDGFTIRNGYMGIYCSSSSPTVTNNTVSGNSYDGIHCRNNSCATITGNTVSGNRRYGINCYGNSSPTITGNTVSGNGRYGVYCYVNSSPGITNNTISANSRDGVYSYNSSPTITNNIVAFNSGGIWRSGGAPVLSHNDVYGNSADYDGIGPGAGDISVDPQFACPEFGDFHIQPTSPCRDAGDGAAPGLPTTDMDGQARDDGGGVDIGADESYGEQGSPCPSPRIVYVDGSASPGGDGTSWATAYQTIGEATGDVRLNGLAEIWVAKGVYNEVVVLLPFAHMYGGFAGIETERSERDWRNNKTVIDGGGGGSLVTVAGANVSTIDGFTIRGTEDGVSCYYSSPTITNNTIKENLYGIYCSSSSPTITNNRIVGNWGDGIRCYDNSSPTITNNTISGNAEYGIYCHYSSSTTVTNNIVAFNSGGIWRSGGAPVLSHNDVYGNSTDYIGIGPGAGDISVDPEFACLEFGNFHIQPTSPCRDAGDNSAPGLPDEDMDGQPRVQGAVVDMGADESDGTLHPSCDIPRIVHVDASASPGGDGTSWGTAYRTIGEGIDDVLRSGGAEIWVAKGVYYENATLVPFAHMYGGFAGIETARSERDWRNNKTVIDGGSDDVVMTANVSTVDGFTIQNGFNGMRCYSSLTTIANNTIRGSSQHGIRWSSGSPTITNNTISGNSKDGIYCYNSSPAITNNTISGNGQDGIGCSSGSPTITNNIVAFNSTGICRSGGAPVLSHNDVYGNSTDYDGIGPGTGDISVDPEFACPEFGDFHIQPTSPCRDAGDNSAPGLPDEDMDGQPRVQGAVVDMGADESDGTLHPSCDIPRIVHVDASASPRGDGTSWGTAYQAIGDAVDDVFLNGGAEIWVAKGVYYENATLVPFAHMYGGFAGIETARSERHWRNNKTVIDGGGSGSLVTVTGADVSTIDGFTIQNGSCGIHCSYSSPTITNNTISGNSEDGIHCFHGSPTITNNTIRGNSWYGVFCASGSPSISNNIASGNFKGGIYCSSTLTAITNNTVSGNAEAGIECSLSSPTITNNIVAFNSEGICANTGAPVLSHNNVYGNTTDYYRVAPGTGDISVDPEFACLEFGDFHIQPTSPCRDAGDNSAPGLPDIDMDRQARDDGGGVDIGADESYGEEWPPCVSPRIVHVDVSASPGGDGTRWAAAYRTIGEAVDDVRRNGGAEIWVARGVYNENVTLVPSAHAYGGFVGGETSRDQREWRTNVTVIDGGSGSLATVTGADLSTIDGFTIRNGSYGIDCGSTSPGITNNTIVGNSYDGIRCYSSSPGITNNTIVGNSYDGIDCSSGSPTITNNTIVGNSSVGILYGSNSTSITNNIVAFNGTGVHGWTGAPVLSHNDVYGNSTDYDGVAPGTGDISVDPEFACWEQWDFHIQPTSPCRDAGDTAAPGLPTTDMDGQARNDGGGVDIGADESYGEQWPPCPSPRIVYVDGSASPGGDGTSWATAYQTIGEATGDVWLNGPAEIWVAEGVYDERVTLVPFAHVYGGFAGTETSRSQRDWRNNVTVMDGGGSGNVVTGVNISTIDGFTMRNGEYGIYCYSSFLTITNNTISGNSYDGIYCWCSSPTITNNTIVGNSYDGIFCCYGSPTITNNTVSGNGYYGIYCYFSSPTIANSTIIGNSHEGIYCSCGSPTFTNNTIVGNSRGIYCNSSSPAITGNTIVGNYNDGIHCYNTSTPDISNNIVAFNSSGICNSGSTPTLQNNDVYGNTSYNYSGLAPGTGDISADPLFVDRPGGEYHLAVASPCVNAGWNDAPGLPLFDMDGEGRIFGGTVDIGADEFWSSSMSVADAKRAPDGAAITGDGAIVSEAFPDFFYIEADDRSSGIRVEKAGHGLTEVVRADVVGSVQTNPDGERHIAADSATASGTGTVSPVGLADKLLGGGDWFYNPATGAGQKGVAGGCGLNNIGLLIRTWGKVTYADTDYFYLDDGSLLDDGSGHVGVKVLAPGLLVPAEGTHVEVTGISSCFKVGDDLHRLIRVPDQADIVALE